MPKKKNLKNFVKKWIAALESGDYEEAAIGLGMCFHQNGVAFYNWFGVGLEVAFGEDIWNEWEDITLFNHREGFSALYVSDGEYEEFTDWPEWAFERFDKPDTLREMFENMGIMPFQKTIRYLGDWLKNN